MPLGQPDHEFTEEEVASLVEYGNVLRDIHARLIREGYFKPGIGWYIFKWMHYSMFESELRR